ncbi:MAG: CRISPR associated protein Cas6 [candidate division TA06 bacterium ADurb.Bin131]|uniref:CRISPR associated protein Cas6 n=1 Tax=candidate division TA06 bacterium ADurb.Bin131 TaxID=1852827 RepID=A0A1V6C9H6_UNCT6|nr:MAG: CRISPR associated protein Cas6 [candidate division TA06 bacterium ADurb.Bin131]
MRIKISFKVEKLPILYRHRIMSLIKESLKQSDPEYKNSLYPDKKSEYSKKVKPFTFSVFIPPGCERKKEKFLVDENIEVEDIVFYFPPDLSLSLFISSCDYQFIINLYNGLLQIKQYTFDPLNSIKMTFERVFLLNERKINTDQVIFKTNSPILIEDEKSSPLLPPPLRENSNLLEFNGHFNAIHNKILQDLREKDGEKGPGLYQTLEFEPLNIRKQVVKHTLKGFREKAGKPYMVLTTFSGCFRLRGDPRDLQLLYQSGIGLRTGQGFGMVEVI